MASEPNFLTLERPAATMRSRTGLEHVLGKASKAQSRTRPGPTPHLERSISSISSMSESFMLDHRGSYRSSAPDNDVPNLLATAEDDALTPISNWAHLKYIKTQRNTLRAELKTQYLAGLDTKRSVTSLRRLALRMAINIAVKERQIATSAQNLSKSREGSYLEGKDAERRLEGLKRALRVEEGRNEAILEALERASKLTLQCKLLANVLLRLLLTM